MWNLKCDCCGQVVDGKMGEAVLPDGWYKIGWKCEGRTQWGEDNHDHDEFILCGNCFTAWPGKLSRLGRDSSEAIHQLNLAHGQAKGFGNQGNAAARRIERALEYLGKRIK